MVAASGIVDPIRLLEQIPPGMHIPRLTARLLAIVESHRGMGDIHQACRKMLDSETARHQAQYLAQRKRARRVSKPEVCRACQRPLEETARVPGSRQLAHGGLIVFWNGNSYHKECLPLPANMPPAAEGAKRLEEQYYSLRDPNAAQAPGGARG